LATKNSQTKKNLRKETGSNSDGENGIGGGSSQNLLGGARGNDIQDEQESAGGGTK